MTYRDSRGRFRSATDAERWPDPVERATMQVIRARFSTALDVMVSEAVRERRDLQFLAGEQWPEAS